MGYLADLPCSVAPGTTPFYSNYLYDIMALAIEKLSGQAFAAVLQETIFEPLGMKDTSFVGVGGEDVAMGLIPRLANGALEPGKGIATGTSPKTGMQSIGTRCQGSYSLISSAEDMVSPSLHRADRRPNGSLPSPATLTSPPPLPARLTSLPPGASSKLCSMSHSRSVWASITARTPAWTLSRDVALLLGIGTTWL